VTARTNWAGNISFGAAQLRAPTSVAELQAIVAGASSVRALGTGHSFNAIADTTGDQVLVSALPADIEIDSARGQVRVGGAVRFGELAPVLHQAGFALHNLGSLPHISIAGACSTGTHGSGAGNANLATAVAGIEYVSPDGELAPIERGDEDFDGSVVALGCLGIITRLVLDLRPAFEIDQYVYNDLSWTQLCEHLLEILDAAYSVSVFTDWRSEHRDTKIWFKQLSGIATPSEWFGARLAAGPEHPVPGVDPRACTQQGGVPGPWHERLPHFRLDFTPSSGEELQTEYLLPRQNALPALLALEDISERIAAVLQISEIRTIAADQLWLSPSYQQDSVALHFTWIPDTAAVLPVLAEIEARLQPLDARPHWGKVFTTSVDVLRSLYPRYGDFEALIAKSDPAGKVRNHFVDTYFRAL
jgi:xylitol oxidase